MRAGRRLLGGEDLVVGVLRGAVPQGLACPLALELGGTPRGCLSTLLPPPPGCLCGAVEAPSQDRVPGVGGGPTGPRLLGVVAVGRAVGRSL